VLATIFESHQTFTPRHRHPSASKPWQAGERIKRYKRIVKYKIIQEVFKLLKAGLTELRIRMMDNPLLQHAIPKESRKQGGFRWSWKRLNFQPEASCFEKIIKRYQRGSKAPKS